MVQAECAEATRKIVWDGMVGKGRKRKELMFVIMHDIAVSAIRRWRSLFRDELASIDSCHLR